MLSNDNWSQFRGSQGDGTSKSKSIPMEWGNDKNVKWKVKIPGKGWSSPVAWGDKVFITTAYKDKIDEAAEEENIQTNHRGIRIKPEEDYRFEI